MDLASLKNIDIKDVLTKLKGVNLTDKKVLVKFGLGGFAILVFLIIYYSFISPALEKQKNQINLMNENKKKTIEYGNNIGTLKTAIQTLTPEYEKNSRIFHSKVEVEELYQNISNFAQTNGLSIINLKKGSPIAVQGNPQPNAAPATGAPGNPDTNPPANNDPANLKPAYYKIPVEFEIKGTFLGYLKFRRSISDSQKVINFDKEEISVLTDTQGQILSKGTVSIMGLPNEYAQ
jgi:Tfp pilus assembly protein PilO